MARRGADNVTVRMGRDLWERFGELAEPDRSAVVRDFVRWFVGEPGAKMPRRPVSRTDEGDQGGDLSPSAS